MFADNLLTILTAALQSQQRKSVEQVQVWLSRGDKSHGTVSVVSLEVVHQSQANMKIPNPVMDTISRLLAGELMLTELGFACGTCWVSCS